MTKILQTAILVFICRLISKVEAFHRQKRFVKSITKISREIVPRAQTCKPRVSLSALPIDKLSLSFPLIKDHDTWGNVAMLSSVASLAQVFGTQTKVGQLLGPPVSGMFIAFILGSIGVLPPGGSPGAKILQQISLTLATPLILLGADLRDCRQKAGSLLGSFTIASLATWISSCVGYLLCGPMLAAALPHNQDGLKIAAALCAKNIGGGINYIAVCQSLQASPQAVAAGLCVDNIAALIYFPVTSALASGRPDVELDNSNQQSDIDTNLEVDKSAFSVARVSTVLAIAATCAWIGERIGGESGSLPCSTIVTLIFALMGPESLNNSIRPSAEMLGTVLLYQFFATAGAPGLRIAESVKASFLPLSAFLVCLYGIHGAILYLCHKIVTRFKPLDQGFASPQRLLVGSSAAIGGPATAIALAQASGWKSLIVPSILVGNIGYAIATFLGIGFFSIYCAPK